MFDFIIQKPTVGLAQRYINKLEPKVNIHIPKDLPLPSVRLIKKAAAAVSKINGLENTMCQMKDEQLKAKTEEFRQIYRDGIEVHQKNLTKVKQKTKEAKSNQERESAELELDKAKDEFLKQRQKVLDEILPEAFAVVRETAKRILGMRHYDIQLVGGIVLHKGMITEMATGEGKTLVATCPAYLNAITGEGVHVVTVNDYLAERDRDWMGPVFEFLGLTVGVIQHDMMPEERKVAYDSDITYGTNNQYGFDYLRDNMVNFKEDMVQRQHSFAIVDEVDSILVDEARTPLIISGPAEKSTDTYYKAKQAADRMNGRRITDKDEIEAKMNDIDISEGYDYVADEKAKTIALSEAGEEKAAKLLGVDNLHDMDTIEYRHHIIGALRAKEFFKRDVDYVIRENQVVIVDEFTGRMMPGRRWSDGLHQAVEAREGIKIERENQTLATITFQNYFRMYNKLSGMTGTAHTEATEFEQIYELDCVVMPTNKPLQRLNHPDAVYRTMKEKYDAVVEEIEEVHAKGQPVLVGTISIEKSELISSLLKQKGVPHQVLNAKYHQMEANIVAQAGRHKAVTIATNMAGRGTDIVLGGNAEFLAKNLVNEKIGDNEDEEERAKLTEQFIEEFRQQCKEEQRKVLEAGGLFVLGTERHESRRIDNQLRGRSGRQGDPGASKFFVSLEDDLMRLFASDKMTAMLGSLGMEEGVVLESPILSRTIAIAQKRVEGFNFEIRKQLLEFDNVMNRQREVIYDLRREILESENVREHILDGVYNTVDFMVRQYLSTEPQGDLGEAKKDTEGLDVYLRAKFNFALSGDKSKLQDMEVDDVVSLIWKGLEGLYAKREEAIGIKEMRYMEKILLLHTIDAKWKDHLYAMDQLKEGIGLRAIGQRDPVIEYKREGFEMFQGLHGSIQQEVAETIYKIQPATQAMQPGGVFSSIPQELVHNDFQSLGRQAPQPQSPPPSATPGVAPGGAPPQQPSAPQPVRNEGPKVGRNDPCPCGSGKKYKKCHGR